MNETLSLILGIISLAIVTFDFFYTTLSGSGAAFITRGVSWLAHKTIKVFARLLGRKVYKLSGMIVNLAVLFIWVLMVWVGLYLVFSSDPSAIVNSKGIPAGNSERLYFTGFTLSTLGMGDFMPKTASFELLTGIFSFFGFVFFTTSMTYLISVSSAVIHKRTLVQTIRNLGRGPEEIMEELVSCEKSYSLQFLSSLQSMINEHSVNHQAYPVLHFYTSAEIEGSFSVNIASLDEAVSRLVLTDRGQAFRREIKVLRVALTNLLLHMENKFSRSITYPNHPATQLPVIPNLGQEHIQNDLKNRRRILGGLLQSEGLDWKMVYNS